MIRYQTDKFAGCVFEISSRRRLEGMIWSDVANEDFQQNRCSRRLLFSVIYHKTAWRNLPKRVKNSVQRRCQTCQTTSGRNFKHLL
ncbi:hypothetical protein TNCV_4922241 [Trichonephila clavipes]|nr:hypothetical protein TNCV_4922241 [Trichonephila clavipes]